MMTRRRIAATAAVSVRAAGEGRASGGAGASASTAPFEPEAPFLGLEWVSTSGDGRGVNFQLSTHYALLRLPGHAQPYRIPARKTAARLIACRIPRPPDALGPDAGYTYGALVTPEHPQQSDAWMWFDPRAWVAHLLDFAVQRWPVEVRVPGGHVEAATLERHRATYACSRPKVQVRFAPHAMIRWLAGRTAKERFRIEVRGDDIAITLTLARWPGQAETLDRMAVLCPGSGHAGAQPRRRATSPGEQQDCDRPDGSARHSISREKERLANRGNPT